MKESTDLNDGERERASLEKGRGKTDRAINGQRHREMRMMKKERDGRM